MSPLYGAMSVCSSTIAWLEAEERERSDWELHAQLSKLGSTIQDLLNCHSRSPTPDGTTQQIEFLVHCLELVTLWTTRIIHRVRLALPKTSERFRLPIGFLVDQIEEMIAGVSDMAESWAIPLDKALSERINLAISQIDPSKTDIPDWREELESISD
jgi:hypothetical protein